MGDFPYYGVGTYANLHWCSHFKIAQDQHVPATSWPPKKFCRYIRMCRYEIKGKKQDQFEFTTTMQKEKRRVVKLPVSKCSDLVDLACILKIRGHNLLELTFREFHVHFEAMVCARSGCRGKTY